MEIFCLYGTNRKEKILFELNEVIDFPDKTSYEGGYDIICTLQIDIGCYHAKCDKYLSATGALYRFSDKLKECYKTLSGSAEYHLLQENDLSFTVSMMSNRHAVINGRFQERPDKNTVLKFEMATDQSCLLPVFQEIDHLKNTYSGMYSIGRIQQ